MILRGINQNIKKSFFFAKRDFKERYVGTSIGQFWYVVYPIVMIFIYTVIFSDIIKMKLNIIESSYAYSIYLVPGILAWTSFATIVGRVTNSFFDKAQMIKKVNVPMYSFQISILIVEFFIFVLSMVLALGFLVIISHPINFNFLWLIPIMILQTLFAFGVGVIFSLFAPFFKDLKEIVPIVIQLWFWMTPIVYLKDMIYSKFPIIIDLNPVYFFIESYQKIFLFAQPASYELFYKIVPLTLITLLVAGYLYKKMVSTIKDII